jgi:DNA-binding CsgD family transcriptional regulator
MPGEGSEDDERDRAARQLAAALREEASAAEAQARLQLERAKQHAEHPTELTRRQREVLALIVHGHTSSEIGARLGVTVKSVERHRADAMHRLGVTSVVEVVSWGLHNGHLVAEGEQWTAERFLSTIRQAPLMVLVADGHMGFRDASDVALRELGYTYDELLQLSVPDIVLDRKDAERRFASYLMTGAQHGTITLQRKDRSLFEASYSGTVRHVGEVAHYVYVLIPE